MGRLTLPESGLIYLDAAPIIYAIEKISPYDALLQPLWQSRETTSPYLVGSELLLLETLVKPVAVGDFLLQQAFRSFLSAREIKLIPITASILETAVSLRATYKLKTPDAIHAATALAMDCRMLITNDAVFERVPNLSVVVLDKHV